MLDWVIEWIYIHDILHTYTLRITLRTSIFLMRVQKI